MKKWTFLTIIASILTSCNQPTFTIEGVITHADGETLYLESLNAQHTIIDSLRLDANGTFRFTHPAPTYPELYQLRLNNTRIPLAIDSIETLHLTASGNQFAETCQLTGSDQCHKMRVITQESAQLKTAFNQFKQATLTNRHREEKGAQFEKELAHYKDTMLHLTLQDPASITAYYIVLQEINGLRIFDPNDPNDCKLIAAVATAFDRQYPQSNRTKQLKEMALQGIAANKKRQQNTSLQATETTLIDIQLYDHLGRQQQLSQLAKNGKTILLDFIQYQAQEAPLYNMELAKLYQKYAHKGFEIYQVSLDTDEQAWRVSADNLPWICVRDPQNTRSRYINLYNITALPTCFIIDRTGGITKRVEKFTDIEKAILTQL